MGITPLKSKPPLKKEYVRLIALECNGVIKYARGARSCAQHEQTNIAASAVNANSASVVLAAFAIMDESFLRAVTQVRRTRRPPRKKYFRSLRGSTLDGRI